MYFQYTKMLILCRIILYHEKFSRKQHTWNSFSKDAVLYKHLFIYGYLFKTVSHFWEQKGISFAIFEHCWLQGVIALEVSICFTNVCWHFGTARPSKLSTYSLCGDLLQQKRLNKTVMLGSTYSSLQRNIFSKVPCTIKHVQHQVFSHNLYYP